MQIPGNQLQPLLNNGATRDSTRIGNESERTRAKFEITDDAKTSADQQSDDVQISDAARQALIQQEVIPLNRSEQSQASYEYYPFPESNSLPTQQQKALQVYTSNQQFSRETETNGEYLGSIDLFI